MSDLVLTVWSWLFALGMVALVIERVPERVLDRLLERICS